MRSGVVHEALSAIDKAEEGARLDLDYRVVASLKEKGLVSAYSTWFYQEMLSSAEELKRLRERLRGTEEAVAADNKSIGSLEVMANDRWARVWWSDGEIKGFKAEIAGKREEQAAKLRAAERLEEKVQRLEAMPAPAEGYRLTIDGNYVMLTEKGSDWVKILPGRLQRLGDSPLEVFEQEIGEFESRIGAQYSRFIEILNLMLKDGFQKEYDVIDCAVRLSTIEGPVPEIYGRMRVINDYFHKLGYPVFKDYNRLIPTFAAARQDGDIEARKEEIIETYRELVKKRYYTNFFTWWLAAEVMALGNLCGLYRGGAIKRYDMVRSALATEGWENRKRHTDYMAVNLARRDCSAEELARELRTQQQRLVSTGRTGGWNLDTASLILLDSKASLEERTDRFVQAYEAMQSYGWDNHTYHTHFYPAAAALSLLPNSAAENVMWLSRIIKRLKADGFADKAKTREGHKGGLTYRALPLLMAAYRGRFSQEVMPHIITHINDPLFQS